MTAVGDDELGERIIGFAQEHGIDTTYVDRRPEPNGIYFASADPGGAREFVYVRRGSAASTVGPDDVLRAPLEAAGALVVGGITQALSASCAEAVSAAVRTVGAAGGRVVYDPNFRDRLTTAEAARAALERVARTPRWSRRPARRHRPRCSAPTIRPRRPRAAARWAPRRSP